MTTAGFDARPGGFPDRVCLPDLLRERVLAHPDGIAVVQGENSLTYQELLQRSSAIADLLRRLGVAPDDRVGIFVEPSIELMSGVWGILLSGAAYLPLSPEYPEDRLRYMIEDAQVGIIFCQVELRARLAELVPPGTTIVTPDDVADATAVSGSTGSKPSIRPDQLAYVIYTSGSSGRPKGVLIEHRSVLNQLRWLSRTYRLDAGRRVLQKTPMSFDAAQWEILATACGSCVVVGQPGLHRDPEAMIDVINTQRVTTLQCVPTLLQALLDTERLSSCTSLNQIFSGGEVLSRSLASDVLRALPGCELINLYGPTECTINASACPVGRDGPPDGLSAVPIGTPVDNTSFHILDDCRRPVATGQTGELYIGGVQVARGYLNRPELTAARFIDQPRADGSGQDRLFRTGDLVHLNADGTVQFVGRADNQVKLRGFRIELDEIRLAVENHQWVRRAAVIVREDARTGYQNLIACVELNPREAALMDQGNHGAHHQSKGNRLQVRAQLSNPGLREPDELSGRSTVALPGREPTQEQRREIFARKTYRFFEGGQVSLDDLRRLLTRRITGAGSRDPDTLTLAELGEILRYFGQYRSDERLLPKYGYASPGSLYATQLYLEIDTVAGLPPGYYYHHPVRHELVLINQLDSRRPGQVRLHFLGKRRAIEPVYRNNIQEVLEIETGHMVGLFEEVLPRYGLDIRDVPYEPAVKAMLDSASEDYLLGTFELVPWSGPHQEEALDHYVQVHPGKVADLPAGQYRYRNGDLERISDELILRKHVIAINQQVYERASVGITAVSRRADPRMRYIDLGRTLQHLSMNDLGLGFMSSGYSSKSGNDLPSAKRIDRILAASGLPGGASYFFVGGRVSAEQRRSEGMKEDAVHMRGPAEMIRADLIDHLPDYMIPNRVVVLDSLPLTANGKVDVRALATAEQTDVGTADRPFVAPRTNTERRVAAFWAAAMRREAVSVYDDFFESGGNSLIAVGLINRLNREFGASLPLQVLFESPTIEQLARRLGDTASEPVSRLVRLGGTGAGSPVFCWPGLGGYAMNLRPLAGAAGADRPYYGVQAYGINSGEIPYTTIRQMAAEDLFELRRRQPSGPYTLWGYSFGARVAYEVAYQLEQAGERVAHLFLIAPGSPELSLDDRPVRQGTATFDDPAYVTILFSVFAGGINDPALADCLVSATDEERFATFISDRYHLDLDLVRRVCRVVERTFNLKSDLRELAGRRVTAPITIFRARGDETSFIEDDARYAAATPTLIHLAADHYSLLREPDLDELVARIWERLGAVEPPGTTQLPGVSTKENVMPHVNIKHFPVTLTEEQQSRLVAAVTDAVKSAFRCDEGVISIALEPVDQEVWNERVYVPEIIQRKDLLCKTPRY